MPELEIVRPAGLLDYAEGLALQRDLHADVVSGRSPGALVLCEHPSVYTAGRRTEPSDLPTNGAPVVDADRGGRITWHGPGQLVAYPIVRLAVPIDVVAWVRDLEQVIIDAAATVGVDARRIDGRSGAWTSAPTTGASPAKVGAIGLHVAEGVTTHGIAINCDNALDAYAAIVPCGIADAGVTTLSAAAGRPVTVADLADVVVDRIRAAEHGMRSGDRISRAARSAASTSTAATSTAATSTAATSTAPARQETLV
ncbi:lipoyl(octanoyl) transferase LipB [Curtobacterium flaccumfaciens pv. oortii]|uniref:lipoyl(octanoyl) transferase LipB n=1 Tax=Curtobacterium flaccumfaciens TaxID=2035 RepID=UPI001BDE6F20|nr:lipoyl(octanoyl) transferase LipB [Curtobacterium flaccumfaciens]MBT1624302.1 lipoyl(octanoyl) transferase LipB [Curtobacterium flaccumfaciens pv. oortii]